MTIYMRQTEQFDACASHQEFCRHISESFYKLLDDVGGIVYDADYKVRFIIDEPGITALARITVEDKHD